jgi:hypothetical protein
MSPDADAFDISENRRRQNSNAQRKYRQREENRWGEMVRMLEDLESQEQRLKHELEDSDFQKDISSDPEAQSKPSSTSHSSPDYFLPCQDLEHNLEIEDVTAAGPRTNHPSLDLSSSGEKSQNLRSPQVAGFMQSGTEIVQSLENCYDNATQQMHFGSAALGPSMMSANHMLPVFPSPGAGVQNYFPGLPYGAIPDTYGQLSYLCIGTPSIIVFLPMNSIPSFGYHFQHMMSTSDPHLCSGPLHGGHC